MQRTLKNAHKKYFYSQTFLSLKELVELLDSGEFLAGPGLTFAKLSRYRLNSRLFKV